MIKEFKTRTGAIFCDTEKKMEYLYVGDYGKENNIKADFLGFKKEINQVPHHNVDLKDKMVVTISTQKGCPMNCMFCDCPKVKFGGNISREELAEEVTEAIKRSGCSYTQRFNLHLARMGEPALNAVNVLDFLREDLVPLVNGLMKADTIHPVFTTMCPKGVGKERLLSILRDFCRLKNLHYKGEAGLQLSINSTDETQRNQLFRGMSLSLADISEIAKEYKKGLKADDRRPMLFVGNKNGLATSFSFQTFMTADKLENVKWYYYAAGLEKFHKAVNPLFL